jgi:hypothetical protein
VVGAFRKRPEFYGWLSLDTILPMRDIFTLVLHAIVTIIRVNPVDSVPLLPSPS